MLMYTKIYGESIATLKTSIESSFSSVTPLFLKSLTDMTELLKFMSFVSDFLNWR
jgi:hypothetical protein